MNIPSRFQSTKFIQAAFVQVTGAIALHSGAIDGGTYVALSTIALAIHGVTDVTDKKINPIEEKMND